MYWFFIRLVSAEILADLFWWWRADRRLRKLKPARWYRPAADQGFVSAQYNLARMYEEGRGSAIDIIEAAHWYRQAAEKGYSTSSEYVRELIRRDQDRQQLRNLLVEGARSAPAGPADASYFAALRDSIRG